MSGTPAASAASAWLPSCWPFSAPMTSTLACWVSMLSAFACCDATADDPESANCTSGVNPAAVIWSSNSCLASVQFSEVCAGSATPMRSPGAHVVVV